MAGDRPAKRSSAAQAAGWGGYRKGEGAAGWGCQGRCGRGVGRGQAFGGRGHDAAKLLEIDRLGQVIKRAIAQCLNGVLGGAIGR